MTVSRISDRFRVGKVVGFQGLRGELKIQPSTNNPELLLQIESVEICLPDGRVLTRDLDSIRLNRRMLLIKFAEWNDRTAVEFLHDAEIYVDREQLAPLSQDEWWVSDLVGLEAYTTDGDKIGKVVAIIDGGNQLLEIQPPDAPPGKTILVPFVRNLVPKVDLKAGRIEVTRLPGLLEPQ